MIKDEDLLKTDLDDDDSIIGGYKEMIRMVGRRDYIKYIAENVRGELGDMIREAMQYGRLCAIEGISIPKQRG